jgi:glycosyltransferase involved in cell wall biosynthesis
MKISLVGPVYPFRGGIAHYHTELIKALKAQGHVTQVISFRRQYPAWLYPGESDRDTSTHYHIVDAQYIFEPFHLWQCWKTAKAIGTFAPDFVLIQWWVTFWGPADFALAWLLRRMKIPVVYLIHNTLPHEAKPWDRWLARLALGQGSAFIVQNPSDKAKLAQVLPQAQPQLCKHPTYQPFQAAIIPQTEARQELGLPQQAHLLLFFGIVRPYKGLSYLLQALAQVGTTPRPLHLVIAGEFWDNVEKYEQQIDDLGLRSQVTIINRYIPNEQAHLLFCSADVLVAPYTGGSQSGVASLGLGYGLPMIITERVAAGLVEGRSSQVIIVPGEDATSLAKAIINSLQRPQHTEAEHQEAAWGKLIAVLEDIKSGIV